MLRWCFGNVNSKGGGVDKEMFSAIWGFLKTSEGTSVTTAISTVVLTATTMIYAWLTAILAKENRLLRKAGTEPQVVAYLRPHPRIHGPLQLCLFNVGQGPAFDVAFRVVRGGEDFGKHQVQIPEPQVPLTALPQGERYESFIGMACDMLANPTLQPFVVEVRYRDLKKREHIERFTMDVRQLEGLSRVGGDPEQELVSAVKEVASELQKWTTRALPVETATRAERRREEQDLIEQMRARREQGRS
jgi:hypothetical protein